MLRALGCAVSLALLSVLATLSAPSAGAAPIAFGAYIPGASEDEGLIDSFARETGRRPVIVLVPCEITY